MTSQPDPPVPSALPDTPTQRARDLPVTDRLTACELATEEYAALVDTVLALHPEEWRAATDCTGWTVRDLVAHLAGAAEGGVRTSAMLRVFSSAMLRTARGPLEFVDYMCQAQIDARARLSDAEVAADLRRWAERAPGSLAAKPGVIRRIRVPRGIGLPPGATVSTMLDVINTRDVWMHRIDLARATGRDRTTTTAEPEVVRQVIRDLDLQWEGPPVALTLTGAGGGAWRVGDGEPISRVREDAVAFMRLLSGRSDECSLASDGDPRAAAALRRARVVF